MVQCNHCVNVYGDAPCTAPIIDAFPLMTMATPRSTVDTTEISNPSDRAVVVDGIKFQVEYHEDPNEVISNIACDPQASLLNFNLRIWEAIMLLPLAQGTTNAPLYLPILSSNILQGGDVADRVLWKRISMLPIFALSGATSPLQQLEHTIRDMGHGPIQVKTKCRIDDRHALFYVRNYVHDLFGLGTATDCNGICVIPVIDECWFKIFYHTRK